MSCSEFINFPIYLYKTKQVEVEDEEEDGDEDEDEDEDEESTEDSEGARIYLRRWDSKNLFNPTR